MPPATRSSTWVAEVDGAVVGFCSVGPSRDADAVEARGELEAIYVDPRFMCRGIGGALVRAGADTSNEDGFDAAMLWVLATKASARAFYGRRGWDADGGAKSEILPGARFDEVRYRTNLG